MRQWWKWIGCQAPWVVMLGSVCACGSAVEKGTEDAGVVLTPLDAAVGVADAGIDSHAGAEGKDASPPVRFITKVISFTPGTCAGFGQNAMPGVVYGPPHGGGRLEGSSDVVSLGEGGEIVVGFEPDMIVDGPGVDFIVFENPFYISGTDGGIFAEPGEVSVSEDLVHWSTFSCTDTTQAPPYGLCAGVNPVISNPNVNSISPFDVENAGGDAFDLATIGVKEAKYVRIRNIVTSEDCAEMSPKDGFDLDAIAIVNASAAPQ